MMKRKKGIQPFESVKVEKLAYDLSNVEPEEYRKEIKRYIQNLYPYMASGLQYVNFSSPPNDEGNAIGSIVFDSDGVEITIPIIMEEKVLKEPTVGICKGKVVPLDKNYLEYAIDYPEYGEQISENELPENMQYITQNGLFQGSDTGQFKRASVVGTIFEEDIDNPYHYYGTILSKTAENRLEVKDMLYCNSSEMLAILRESEEFQDKNANEDKSISGDRRIIDVPSTRKITDSGYYRNVMAGGKTVPMDVHANLFSIEGGKTKSLGHTYGEGDHSLTCNTESTGSDNRGMWCYGDAYGSGYVGEERDKYRIELMSGTPMDAQGWHIVFSRPVAIKRSDGYRQEAQSLSSPYKVNSVETLTYGPSGEKAMVMMVKSLNDDNHYKLIITDAVSEIKKVDSEKLKNSNLRYLGDNGEDVYMVPENYLICILPNSMRQFDGQNSGYASIVREIEKDYDNNMSIVDKGSGKYTVNVSNGDTETNHRDVSKNAALLLANYYTGQKHASISEYKTDGLYAFKGDIAPRMPNRIGASILSKYAGEYKSLAIYIDNLGDDLKKSAEIGDLVDKITGIEKTVDDEHIDTSNALQLIDNVISKIGEMLLMSRIGKNNLSESILSRALYAMVKMSNEIRGLSSEQNT